MEEIRLEDGSYFRFDSHKRHGGSMASHHYHDHCEIYYMVSGKCNYFIDNRSYEIMEGDIILIPRGIIHRAIYSSEEHERMLIECSDNFIPKAALAELGSSVHFYRNPSTSGEIYTLLKKLDEECKRRDEYFADSISAWLKILFFTLIRSRDSGSFSASKNTMVESTVNYIKANFHTDIRLSNMAKFYFVSPEHLSRTFKKDTGFGFNEFLTLIRLQHAENLLKDGENRSVSEIAYLCGFNDSNYFSDKFKKTYGMAPLKFSKMFKGNHDI